MPNLLTHNYFALDVLKKSSVIRKSIKGAEHTYEIFSASFDPFFVYESFPWREKIGYYLHNNHTDDFFLNFIQIIKDDNLKKDPIILAALYGHLTHYVLDSACHPYIIYKSGRYNKKDPETYKYLGVHTKMEVEIDAYLYETREGKKFSNYKMHELISYHKLNKKLVKVLDQVYLKTFLIKDGGVKYQKALNVLYFGLKHVTKDKRGLKKSFYKKIDKLVPKKSIKYEYFSYHVDEIDEKIFNNDHKIWYYPSDKKISSHESFQEIYDRAINQCLELYKATEQFLNGKISEAEYKKVLGDRSYSTGLSWRSKAKMKYYEY